MALTFKGFSSRQNEHRHLLKHVVRVIGWASRHLASDEDPERWSELMRATLPRALPERRRAVLDSLRAVQRCAAGRRAPCTPDPCEECRDLSAVNDVESRLEAPLRRYEAVAREVFEWNREAGWSRLLVRRTEHGTVLEAYDDRYLFMAADVSDASEVAVRTLYRKRSRPSEIELALEQSRASYEATGSLLDPAAL